MSIELTTTTGPSPVQLSEEAKDRAREVDRAGLQKPCRGLVEMV
jgi:hypothetical protein